MTQFLLKIFVKDYKNAADKSARGAIGSLAGIVGIFCNIFLCAIKIMAGIMAKSISIIADGLNNLSDMGSSLITMLGFKLSAKPADKDHPFGHGRIEYMSAFTVAVLILVVGFELLISAVKSLISGEGSPTYGTYSIVVLSVSVVIKLWMFFFNRKLGKLISSDGLFATAQDSINDAAATLAVLISVIAVKLFDIRFNLDACLALLVAVYIIWSGISSAKTTISNILGRAPDKKLIKELESIVMSFDGFLGIHDLIIHDYGPERIFASLHIEVPQNVNIVECHEQIDLCEKIVHERTGIELVIHMDPIDTDNEQVNRTKAAMIEIIKSIDSRFTLHDFRMTPKSSERTNLIFDLVLPSDFKGSVEELNREIQSKAKQINKTFVPFITFDRDMTGQN